MYELEKSFNDPRRNDDEDTLPEYYQNFINLKQLGEITKTHAFISGQTRMVLAWIESREGSGIKITQEVTSGVIIKRKIKAETKVETK